VNAAASAKLPGLVRCAVRGWIDDDASSMGAALAFYTLFSLAPLLLVAIAVAGMFIGRGEAQSLLLAQVALLVGDNAAAGVGSVLEAASAPRRGMVPAIVGSLTLLVGATTVFTELRGDLDRIWRYRAEKARGIAALLRTRLLSFGLVMAIGFMLIVSLVASTVLAAIGDRVLGGSAAIANTLEFAVSFLVVTLLFAIIYKVLPSARIAWRDVWVGAAVTSALFWIGKFLIGLYLGKAAIGSAFGAAGTLVAIIVWVYYSAMIFLLGAEFTREYALHHGSRRAEADGALAAAAIPAAANEDHIAESIVERAQAIVKGRDPVLLRREK